jgi:hypothetical protein
VRTDPARAIVPWWDVGRADRAQHQLLAGYPRDRRGRPTGDDVDAGGVERRREFSLDGRHYTLSGGSWGSRYALVADGTPVARADHVGRRDWTLDADGRTRTFRRRRSVWSGDQVLVEGDRVLGGVRHAGRWRGDAEAELPGMDLPVQVLAVAVVLTLWSHQASAAVT